MPVGDEDIMPNKGEPLTKPQQELIRRWVSEGAEWPATGDAHISKELAARVLPKIVFELPSLDAEQQTKIDAAVAELKKRGAVVQQVAQDTKALDVNLSLLREKVGDAEMALLPALAPVLVWLNVSRTAVSDAGAKHFAALTQLRRLNACEHEAVGRELRGARHVVAPRIPERVWHGALRRRSRQARRVAEARAALRLAEQGHRGWSQGCARARREAADRPRRLRRGAVGGSPEGDRRARCAQQARERRLSRHAEARGSAQTVEHEGKRIGFCCAKCKAAFTKDPAKYADKIVLRKEEPK
jgi:YHS domain-containing protein